MSAVVREATAADAQAVAELLTELGAKDVDAAEAAKRLGRRIETVFVADEDGELLGLVAVKSELYLGHSVPWAHVTALVTRSGARRGGVARQLMAAAADFSRRHAYQGVELTCGLKPEREAAHRFYRSLGYESTSTRYCLRFEDEERDPAAAVSHATGRIRAEAGVATRTAAEAALDA